MVVNEVRTAAPAEDMWDVDHPVLRALRERRDASSLPGNRLDGYKIGLAVEGGGMRGVVSASMLSALEDFGFGSAFDAVYGCSSGSINCAYFLGGGTWYPVSIYFDDLTTKEFVDFWRLLKGKSILNLDYALDYVMEQVKPLAYEKALASRVKFVVPVTLVDEMRTLAVSEFTSKEDLKATLKASAWLPVGVKGTADFRGQRAVDGGTLTALPFQLALDDGCTHILSLSTRPMGAIKSKLTLMHRYTARHLDRLRDGLGRGYLEATMKKYQDQAMLARMRHSPSTTTAAILDLAPLPGTREVKREELRRQSLLAATQSAYEVMYAALERRPSSAVSRRLVEAVPHFAIVERDNERPGGIRLIDHTSRQPISWGPEV